MAGQGSGVTEGGLIGESSEVRVGVYLRSTLRTGLRVAAYFANATDAFCQAESDAGKAASAFHSPTSSAFACRVDRREVATPVT